MASRTTNLDLILPVGGENVSRQIINENNTKIDDAYGALNNNVSSLSDQIGNMSLFTMVTAFNNTAEATIATYGGRNFNNVKGYIIIAITDSEGNRIYATTIVPLEVFSSGYASVARFINIDNNTLVPITLRVTRADNTHVSAYISSSEFYGKVYAFNYQNS